MDVDTVQELLPEIVHRIPPPVGDPSSNTMRAMLVDSEYDSFRGVVKVVRVFDGKLQKGDKIKFCSHSEFHDGGPNVYEVQELGVLTPDAQPMQQLLAGQAS